MRAHAEARVLIVAPPSRKARSIGACMAFVHEAAGHGAGTGVEIFVAAPHGEIAAAVVQVQREIAGRVRKIETDDAAFAMCERRDRLEIERLARAVLHAGE